MSRPTRLLRAFPLAAPVACAAMLLGDALVRAMLGSQSLPSPRAAADLVFGVAAIGTPLAYGATLVAGAPVYLLLRRAGIATRWTLWLGGVAIGAAVALLLQPYLRGDLFSIPFPWWAGALLGLVTAETFWRLLMGESADPPRSVRDHTD
jgi:hypothetical protein